MKAAQIGNRRSVRRPAPSARRSRISLNSAPAAEPARPRPLTRSSDLNSWREQYNPLRSLTIAKAVSLMDAAQRGEFADLQWTYHFAEQTEAILFALLERRLSALVEMDWTVKIISEKRRRASFEEKLAQDQAVALGEMYDRIDNLNGAIEHLGMAAFRLFAHLNIHRNAAGDVKHLEPLDQWNFVRAGLYGDWYWNPEAKSCGYKGLPQENKINPSEYVIRSLVRHIDRIALIKFIRKNLGEKDWSGFVEIYGIPPCFIVMPQNVPSGKESDYEDAAEDAAAGGGGALPFGSDVKFSTPGSGVTPFQPYLDWLDQQIVLVGTGGLLTMLSMPQGIGSGSTGAHEDTFRTIAGAEAMRVSEVFQKQLDEPLLSAEFPGKPVLAYFEIESRQEKTPGDILADLAQARAAGFIGDASEASERTGYTLSVQPAAPSPFGLNSSRTRPGSARRALSMRPAGAAADSRPAGPGLPSGRIAMNADQFAPDNPVMGKLLATARQQLSEAQAAVLQPLRKRLEIIMQMGEYTDQVSALKRLQADLPAILVDINADPETAKVIEETLSAALLNGYIAAADGHSAFTEGVA